jgi:predicted dehydrogenase
MTKKLSPDTGATRRDFLKTTAAGAAALAAAALPGGAFAAGTDQIKVGLIGCGDRGTGAVTNKGVLTSAPNVVIWAMADAFEDKLNDSRKRLNNFVETDGKEEVTKLGNKVDVEGRCFVGLDAYQKLLETEVNYVILTTPPGFRPIHLKAAVEAGKNIFTEKPVCVDASGYRSVIDTYEAAKKKNLAIVAGTQRRHQLGYLESMKRIPDEMGTVVAGRAYWNTGGDRGGAWFHPRKPRMTDVQYQLYNWYHFTWLCGDNIVEQHVHNLDVMNWAIGSPPVNAVGMGGRQTPWSGPDDGHKFDHFAVDFEYPNGVHVMSMCRQVTGCEGNVSEALVGTKGMWYSGDYMLNGKRVITKEQDKEARDPYVQEHADLIESIRAGKPLNELKQVAESTMTSILGRMTTYTGEKLTWEKATTKSQEKLMPDGLTWDSKLPEWKIPVPGQTKFV